MCCQANLQPNQWFFANFCFPFYCLRNDCKLRYMKICKSFKFGCNRKFSVDCSLFHLDLPRTYFREVTEFFCSKQKILRCLKKVSIFGKSYQFPLLNTFGMTSFAIISVPTIKVLVLFWMIYKFFWLSDFGIFAESLKPLTAHFALILAVYNWE